jgi:hypothetical protein
MKKIIITFLFFVICASQEIKPQSFVTVFSNHIPNEYLKDEDKVEQMEINLNYYAMINPDLIYYYLNYLDISANNKVFNRDSNYFSILNYEASISSKLNNEWVEKKIKIAESLSEPTLAKNELESLLDDFEVQEFNAREYSVKLFIDKNLQKFYSYKSLTTNQDLIYDEKLNYQKLFDDKIKELISQMKSDYENNLPSGNRSNRKIELDFLYQHHIFSNGFAGVQIDSTELNFIKYLLSFIDYSKFEENSGIIVGFYTETVLQDFPGETFAEPYLPYSEITVPSTTSEIAFYNLSIGYRVKLKEFKSAFSHLDINASYSFSSSSISSDTNKTNLDKFYFIWEGEPGNFTLLFFGTIESVIWELNNFSEFSFYANTPVFYLSHNLFFDIGLQYKYFSTEYTVTVHRDIEDQTAEDPSILGPEDETVNFNSDSNLFGGFIGVNYSPIRNFTLICSISTFKAVQLGFNYLLTF